MNQVKSALTRNRRGKMILLIIIFICLLFIKQFYFIVSPGERGLLVRLGNLQKDIFDPGFHLKLPFIEHSIMMNVQTQKVERSAESASKDLQIVQSTIALNYNLDPTKVNSLYQNIGPEYVIETKIIEPAIQETVKAANAKFTAEELITKRQEVSVEMNKILTTKLEKVGIMVSDINIVDYQFSQEFNIAIENKVKAEQDALAEKNRLEKIKYEAQQKIEAAKGEKEAILLKAQGEAEAIRIQSEAIKAQGGKDYVSLKWIERRDGVLPQTSLGSNMPVIMNLGQ